MVNGLPEIQKVQGVCETCAKGKQHRTTIPKVAQWRATKPLQLVHTDLCGPITPRTAGDKGYVLTFIDDFSRKTWVYFLSEKCEAFNKFKIFKTMVENEVGTKLLCLRSDRGGEFNSKEFNDFCATNGVKRQLTAAYTPQQNGVAERKNRTIMDMVRCLLSERKMPKKFWGEATKWTAHILNRSPTSAVKDQTPQECWSNNKPNVDYFKIFGCIGHVHVPTQKRVKLDERCIFLGMSDESKAYKMYDPISETVVISKDVIFDEEQSWNWGRTVEEERNDILIIDEQEAADNNIPDEESSQQSLNTDEINEPAVNSDENSQGRRRVPPRYLQDFDSGSSY